MLSSDFSGVHVFTLDFSAQRKEEERVAKAEEHHPNGGGGLGKRGGDDMRWWRRGIVGCTRRGAGALILSAMVTPEMQEGCPLCLLCECPYY